MLVGAGVEFPRTHSLRLLVDLLPVPLRTDPLLEPSVALTDYAVTTRYPGEMEAPGPTELAEAIRLARAVVRWAGDQVRAHRPADPSV